MPVNDTWDPIHHLRSETAELFNKLSCRSDALALLDGLAQYIKNGSRQFFVQWTDHKLTHVESILDNAGQLITPTATELLSPEDIMVLLTATMLHDIAMTFDEETFTAFLEFSKANDLPLYNEWKTYIAEIQHWDQQDVIRKFGDLIDPPKSLELADFTNKQNYYAGEFLRRHHCTIARSIFDGPYNNQSFVPLKGLREQVESADPKFRNLVKLSGIVAESHGLELRQAIQNVAKAGYASTNAPAQLQTKVLNVHYAYIMSLLRLADYLDFRNSSAQYFIKQFITLRSPISILEHETMKAFQSATWQTAIESVQLEYDTNDPHVYWNFQKIYTGIQQELDTSWAVISEHYASTDAVALSYQGLSIRRVYSHNYGNVDLSNKYFPEPLRITVSDSKIIYLLAGPLYGNDPVMALRETISNSHDACSDHQIAFRELGYTISLTVDIDQDVFIIQDNGVGMSFEEVGTFFLRVGGRLRGDLGWKKASALYGSDCYSFASRFGVGAVSLFMLGEDVLVRTKKEHFDGVEIRISPSTSDIIATKARMPRGTTIQVSANRNRIDAIDAILEEQLGRADTVLDMNVAYIPLCFNLLRYVPYRFPLTIKWSYGGLSRTIVLPSFEDWLVSISIDWLTMQDTDLLPGAKCALLAYNEEILARDGRDDSGRIGSRLYVIYNGIMVDAGQNPLRRVRGSCILILDDRENRLSFNLEKSKLEGDTASMIDSASRLAAIDLLDAAASAKSYSHLLVNAENGFHSWRELPTTEIGFGGSVYDFGFGRASSITASNPYVFFYGGGIVPLTKAGVSALSISIVLGLFLTPSEYDSIKHLLPPELPIVVLNPDNPGTRLVTRIIGESLFQLRYLDKDSLNAWLRLGGFELSATNAFFDLLVLLKSSGNVLPVVSIGLEYLIKRVSSAGFPNIGLSQE